MPTDMDASKLALDTAVIWKPIPKMNFLEHLAPGQYLLRKNDDAFVKCSDENQAQHKLRWISDEGNCSNGLDQHNLTQIINDKFEAYNANLEEIIRFPSRVSQNHERGLREKLEDINEFLRMGFDSFVQVHLDNDLGWVTAIRETEMNEMPPTCEDAPTLVFSSNLPATKPITVSDGCATGPNHSELYEKIAQGRCMVSLCRLEDEMCPEKIQVLWNRYNNSNHEIPTMTSSTLSNPKWCSEDQKSYNENDEDNIPLAIRIRRLRKRGYE